MQIAEFSEFSFQNGKKYYFSATRATYNLIYTKLSGSYKIDKLQSYIKQVKYGVDGVHKKSFFSFQK